MGFPTPVLIITQGVLFGRQEYEKIYCRKYIGNPSMKMRGKSTDMANAEKKADYILSRIVTISTLGKKVSNLC